MDVTQNTASIHYRYWIGILAVGFIVVIAVEWTKEPKFTEYIGNVATMASLLLGVIAILYSFSSNSTLSNSLGNITNAAESLKRSEIGINNVLNESQLLTSNHSEDIQKLQRISDSVDENVVKLAETMAEISTKTNQLQAAVSEVPEYLARIEKRMTDEKPAQQNAVPVNKQGMSVAEAAYFNKVASVNGNLVTIACVLANKFDREMSSAALNSLLSRNYTASSNGFIDCMAAAGIIQKRDVRKKNFFKIVWVDETIKETAQKDFVDWINDVYRDSPDTRDRFLTMVKLMEDAFEGGDLDTPQSEG